MNDKMLEKKLTKEDVENAVLAARNAIMGGKEYSREFLWDAIAVLRRIENNAESVVSAILSTENLMRGTPEVWNGRKRLVAKDEIRDPRFYTHGGSLQDRQKGRRIIKRRKKKGEQDEKN